MSTNDGPLTRSLGCLIAVVTMTGACGDKGFPAVAQIDNRVYSQTPTCLIGSIVVKDASNNVTCHSYSPKLNHEGCASWPQTRPADEHHTTVNSLAAGTGNMAQRQSQLPDPLKRRTQINARGQIMLVSTAAGIQLTAPQQVAGGASYERLDLLVDISPLYIALTDSEKTCLEEQSRDDVATAFPNVTVMGFVSGAVLGFANKMTLSSAKVKGAVQGVVQLEAKHFTLDARTHGLIAPEYLDQLKKVLENLSGTDAVLNSTRLTMLSPGVTQVATTFLDVRPFPALATAPTAPLVTTGR